MTTYDLRTQDVTIDELFRRAADEAIRVITKDGYTFVIELADDFEREVALLSQSERFMAFLAERSRHKEGSISLDELEREIELELAREQAEATDDANNQQGNSAFQPRKDE